MMEETKPAAEPMYEVIHPPISEHKSNIQDDFIVYNEGFKLYEKILQIENDSNQIICLCFLDFLLNTIYLWFYVYPIPFLFLFLFIGYRGASKRNACNIKWYMIYQSVQVGTKTMFFVFLLQLNMNPQKRIRYRIEHPNSNLNNNINTICIYTIFNLFFNISFSCYLRKYYNLLPYLKIDPNYIII